MKNSVRRSTVISIAAFLVSSLLYAVPAVRWDYTLSAPQQQAVAAISAESLRGHLSFIASDLLQGRKDGTVGESVAAEYIAAQFRRAGLEPAGDHDYFQTVSRSGDTRSPLRNVIGLLPGSDPKLAGSYILLTAHYDGTGPQSGVLRNAANDDGSGTVSVIEIASVLATLKERPRRSLVFMTFCGEEVGDVGSGFYGRHPLFPLEKTIADINLEQVGRTDSSEGDQTKRASLTGFDYSNIGEILRRAGELTGITVYKDTQNSDRYFSASDNAELAGVGIPAHTLCVAFMFPDYHGTGDTWQKVNYENMAATDRMVATALLILAQSADEPRWNADEPKASRFLEAWKRMHPGK